MIQITQLIKELPTKEEDTQFSKAIVRTRIRTFLWQETSIGCGQVHMESLRRCSSSNREERMAGKDRQAMTSSTREAAPTIWSRRRLMDVGRTTLDMEGRLLDVDTRVVPPAKLAFANQSRSSPRSKRNEPSNYVFTNRRWAWTSCSRDLRREQTRRQRLVPLISA